MCLIDEFYEIYETNLTQFNAELQIWLDQNLIKTDQNWNETVVPHY